MHLLLGSDPSSVAHFISLKFATEMVRALERQENAMTDLAQVAVFRGLARQSLKEIMNPAKW